MEPGTLILIGGAAYLLLARSQAAAAAVDGGMGPLTAGGMGLMQPAAGTLERPGPSSTPAPAGGGMAFRIGGAQVATGLRVAAQVTRIPILGLLAQLVGLILPPASAAAARGPLYPPGAVTEVPPSMRAFAIGTPPPEGAGSRFYEPSAGAVGYNPRGLQVTQTGATTATGVVETIQGPVQFSFNIEPVSEGEGF